MADAVASRELKSLQDELLASQRERTAAPPAPVMMAPSPAEPPEDSSSEHELREQLRELASEVTTFFEEAEKVFRPIPHRASSALCLSGY